MRFLYRSLLALLLAGASLSPSLAQDAPSSASSAPTPAQQLSKLGSALDAIRASVDAGAKNKEQSVPLNDLRSQAQDVQQQADQLVSTLLPQQANLDAQIGVLGPAPAKGSSEPAALSAQRKQLDKAKSSLQGQIIQAQSLSKNAAQLAVQMAQLRRDQFQSQLAERTATPFSAAFWSDPLKAYPDDMERLHQFGSEVLAAWAQAWQPPNRAPFILCLLFAVLLFSAGRRLVEYGMMRLTADRMPAGKLRRSALAVTAALASTLTIGLAAYAVYLALNWHDILDEDLDTLGRHLVSLVFFCAFMAGLGRAILSNRHPSWRLPALSDDAAHRLRAFPWLLGSATLILGTVERVSSTAALSLPATIATRCLLSLLIGGLIGGALLRLGKSRRASQAAGKALAPRPLWVGLVVAAAFVGVGLIGLGVATGYIAFAFFIARQMLWVGVILTALYLLMHLVDDIFDSVFAPKGRTGQRLQESFGLDASKLEQAGTVLSGLSRSLLVILAVTFVLAPYGAEPQELLGRVGSMLTGSSLGGLPIAPDHIFDALLVLLLGVALLRILKRWLNDQLLPKTSMDLGMQTSMMTLLSYVGWVLIVVLVLLTLNVNLQSIAWMASALSVGIGFGLQAIVQNFISGLILLAERPVKVGDWVSIGGVEGDIKRINVRATEIQMSDRSTMIVPNSQFITQNVRNVTLANAQGRVHIKLPMPVDTDAGKARQIILEAFQAHPSTLETPSPYVQLESVDAVSMNFAATAYVRNPRDASTVKSDLLFEILQRLRDAQLPLSKPQDMVVRTLGAIDKDGGGAPFPSS